MKRFLALLVALAAITSLASPVHALGKADAKSAEVAAAVMKALGGQARWDALHGLRWSFGNAVNDSVRSTRRHAWDRRTGQHRVEGVTRTGTKFVFVHTVGDTLHGKAWMNGQPVEGDSLLTLLKRAEALWINDTYWLLMPYKLRDDGVTLEYAGEAREGDVTYDKLALSFANVGMTPGDRYWVWVDRANHRIARWDMLLQGEKPPVTPWTLEGWVKEGDLWFSTAHRQKAINVFTNAIEVVDDFAPGTFEKP